MEPQRVGIDEAPENVDVSLWGEVATLRFTVTASDEQYDERGEGVEVEEDRAFWEVARALGKLPLYPYYPRESFNPRQRRRGNILKLEIQSAIRERLGDEFTCSIVDVTKGSIAEITIVISTVPFAGVAYIVVNYDKLRRNLLSVLQDIQQFIDKFLGEAIKYPMQLTTSGNVTPSPALLTSLSLEAVKRPLNQSRNFLVYIALIHSVFLLAILIIVITLISR